MQQTSGPVDQPAAKSAKVGLVLRVWCKEDAGSSGGELVRYGIAVTIESENALPIYDQIQQRLRVRPQA